MKSSAVSREIPIGELAENFGLATHVLRHWESMGLLAPHRSSAGHRVYGRADRYRVAAILQAKDAGMGLDDIRAILTAPTPAERNSVLQHQHHELTRRIAEAQAALALIDKLIVARENTRASVMAARLADEPQLMSAQPI